MRCVSPTVPFKRWRGGVSAAPCRDVAVAVAGRSRGRARYRARFPARAPPVVPPAPRSADEVAACALPQRQPRRARRPASPPQRRPAARGTVLASYSPLVKIANLGHNLASAVPSPRVPGGVAGNPALATFLQLLCRLLQSALQVVPPREARMTALSSEVDAGTPLATEGTQGVGDIGFVQPSHEPSSIHPAHLLHSLLAPLH